MKPAIRRRNKNEAISPTEKSVYCGMLYLLRVFHNDEDIQNLYYRIYSLCLSVMTTADCKRVFSALKLVKNPLINRLKTKNLNNALLVAIEGEKIVR